MPISIGESGAGSSAAGAANNRLLNKQWKTEGRPAGEARTLTQVRAVGASRPHGYSRPAVHARRKGAEPVAETGMRVPIGSHADILEARRRGRELAASMGFARIDCTLIATAISELARNIVLYAGAGEICLRQESTLGGACIAIVASDDGPGIRDLRAALQEGYSTSHGLGLGLPGVKRIMDEFDMESKPRHGTTVTIKKWKT